MAEKPKKARKLFVRDIEKDQERTSEGGEVDTSKTVVEKETTPAPGTTREERNDSAEEDGDPKAAGGHYWEKVNLVTRPDGTDLYRCAYCAKEFKRKGLDWNPPTSICEESPSKGQLEREATMADFDQAPESPAVIAAKDKLERLTPPNFEQQLAAQMGVKPPEPKVPGYQVDQLKKAGFDISRFKSQAALERNSIRVPAIDVDQGVEVEGQLVTPPPAAKIEKALASAGELPEAVEVKTIREIPIAELHESPFNARKIFGDLKAFAETIKAQGILQPLQVRLVPEYRGKGPIPDAVMEPEIVFGHKRFLAAKLAGLKTVPCVVVELSDEDVQKRQLIENVQREDPTPLEQAVWLERLMKKHGATAEGLGKQLGKSKRWVYMTVDLLKLSPELQHAVNTGNLPATAAEFIVTIIPSHDLQAKAWSRMKGEDGRLKMSTREARAFLTGEFATPLKHAPFNKEDPTLVPEMGACTKCPHRSINRADLFDGSTPDLCLKTSCFKEKSTLEWQTRAREMKAKGFEIASVPEGRKIMAEATGLGDWVLLNSVNGNDSRKRTWKQLLSELEPEDRPTATFAPDDHLAGHLVVKASEVMKAGKKAGASWAEKAPAKTHRDKADPEKERQEKIALETRESTQREVVAQCAATVKKLDQVELNVVVLALASMADSGSPALVGLMRRRNLIGPKLVEKWAANAKPAELSAFIFEFSLTTILEDPYAGYDPKLKDLAKLYGVDFKRVEEAQAIASRSEHGLITWGKETKTGVKGTFKRHQFAVKRDGSKFLVSVDGPKTSGRASSATLSEGRAGCEGWAEGLASKEG